MCKHGALPPLPGFQERTGRVWSESMEILVHGAELLLEVTGAKSQGECRIGYTECPCLLAWRLQWENMDFSSHSGLCTKKESCAIKQ